MSEETNMVTRLAWWKSIFDTARDTVNAAKKLIEEEVVQPVAEKTETFTGQAVLEEVRAYMAENEVINTALVTRLKESESENAALKTRLTKMESRVRSLTILGLVLAVLFVGLTVVAVLHWTPR
jgi:CHASE3 domain sensor protein